MMYVYIVVKQLTRIVTMLEEFRLLKQAADMMWPPSLPTNMCNPNYDDIIYSSRISGSEVLLHMTRASDIDRIRIRLSPVKPGLDSPDYTDILLELGYKIIKNGRVVYEHPEIGEVLSFVIHGLRKRVEWHTRTLK